MSFGAHPAFVWPFFVRRWRALRNDKELAIAKNALYGTARQSGGAGNAAEGRLLAAPCTGALRGIPHDVQNFLRPSAQLTVLSAAGFYDLCAESSCCSGYRPEKRPERGQPIYDRPAWSGMTVPIPAGRHRRLYGAKKEIGGPFRERLSLFGAVCSSPFLTK